MKFDEVQMSGLDLNPNEIIARIKFDEMKSKYDEKIGNVVFVKCRSCKGTGLVLSGGTWCGSYCEKCKGYGGEFVSKELAIECDKCKSLENKKDCRKCGGSGYVDWIENIVGKR